MKVLVIAIVLILASSCEKQIDTRIYGDWHFQDRFYQASYQILELNGKIIGKVLHYDDGTTVYQWDEKNPKYIFQNLQLTDNVFVDGMSGATMKSGNRNIEIEVLHKDTLSAKIFTNAYPTVEQWIRNK